MLHNKWSHLSEKPMYRNKEYPPLSAIREKPVQQQKPSTTKNK